MADANGAAEAAAVPPEETMGDDVEQPPHDDTDAEAGPERLEPVFNVPPGVLILLAIMVAVHLIRLVLPEAQDELFVIGLALIPARFTGFAAELPGGEIATYTSLVTHMFVHGDMAHLMFNGASLLAFGGAMEKRIGGLRLAALGLVSGLAGAAFFVALNIGLLAPMIGASGAISGLMGGVMRYFFTALDQGGLRQLHEDPRAIAAPSLFVALRDRRLQIVTASFLVMNLVAYFGLSDVATGAGVAWEAHIGGFLAGLLLFGLFDVAPRNELRREPNEQ